MSHPTKRTVSAEEPITVYRSDYQNLKEQALELARLSAWVSGDVARAREIVEEFVAKWDPEHYPQLREVVALLTPPKDTEGDA